MAGDHLIIAILGLICGTIGAAFVWRDLRDSRRRFANRARLGLDTGLESYVPAGMRTDRRETSPGGEVATESADQSVTHNNSGSKYAARGSF